MSPDNTNPVQIKCWITSSIYCLEQFLFIYLFFLVFWVQDSVMKMKTEAGFVDERSESSFDVNFILLNETVAIILTRPHKIITNVEFTQ